MIGTEKLLSATERSIAKLLAKLEMDTGMVIDHLYVADIEITAATDDRRHWARRVAIEMKRLPGTRWDM